MDFDEALAKAAELGYAEADPTADIEGLDAGRKAAIMASIAFHSRVVFSDVYTEPPCSASRSLLAVTTLFPESRAFKIIVLAGSIPPMASITMRISSSLSYAVCPEEVLKQRNGDGIKIARRIHCMLY